jgi:hypothetical protein
MQPGPGATGGQPIFVRWPLCFAVLVVLLTCIVFHLGLARQGYPCYRDQHVGTALEYAKGRIDVLNPIIIGFNASNTPTPLELPIWQTMTALLFKAFGTWFGWANVTSFLFGLGTLWPLYDLARAYSGPRAAWWALLFYVSQPLVFYYNGRGATDGSCLTFALWFLYSADLLLRTGHTRWLLPTVFFGSLSAVTKAPFFFCVGLTSFFLLLLHGRRDVKRWGLLLISGALPLGVFAWWTAHTNAVLAAAEFPLVDLRLNAGADGGQFMRFWYFGDWHYRLAPGNWLRGGWRFLTAELGSLALSGLLLWGLALSKNRLGQLLFISGGMTTLVFTHLVLHHNHYYLMFSPAVAMLCGWAAAQLEARLVNSSPGVAASLAFVGILTSILFLSTAQGLIGMKIAAETDPYPHRIAKLIQDYTSANDKLLIQGGGWGGNMLMLSNRRGLSIWDTKFLEQPRNLERIRALGFTKLVMISESPMLLALQQANPGQANQQRDLYVAQLSPVADLWPALIQTEDLLIKEIPLSPSDK